MNELDDVFSLPDSDEAASSGAHKPGDYAEQQRQKRAELYALADETFTRIAGVDSAFALYLTVQGRHIGYSPTNAALILAQCPDAVFFRDWKWWSEKGVSTKPGTGFFILESGKQYFRQDESLGRYINPKEVYDAVVLGVEPAARPQIGESQFMRALHGASPVKFCWDDGGNVGANNEALYVPAEKVVYVRRNADPDLMLPAMAREAAFAALERRLGNNFDSLRHGRYAEIAACFICNHFGFDPMGLDLAECRAIVSIKNDPKEIKTELQVIRDTAYDLASGMSRALARAEAQKQRAETDPAR